MLSNPFTVFLNNNDERTITAELDKSEIPQQNINVFKCIIIWKQGCLFFLFPLYKLIILFMY